MEISEMYNPLRAFHNARSGNTYDMNTGEFMGYVDGRGENAEQAESTANDVGSTSAPCNCGCSKGKKKAFPRWVLPSAIVAILMMIIYLTIVTDGKK